MRNQLLKRADTLNEELARPGAGSDTPDPVYQVTNPFNNKRMEENMVLPDPVDPSVDTKVAEIKQHSDTKFLPPRAENRKHYDEEVQNELKAEKEASLRLAIDFTEVAQALNPTEVRLLRLVQRKSGQDPIQAIYPFSGMNNLNTFMSVMNNLARKGLASVKDNRIFKNEVTERLLMTYDALKTPGTVVGSMRFNAQLLNRRNGLPASR